DVERGINRTARKETAVLLAGALGLPGAVDQLFVAAARGRGAAAEVLAARDSASRGVFAAAATRALPRDIASFTGRQTELVRLLRATEGPAANRGVVGIHAIDGMAGIGKTTFAVHAAHRLAADFPDGQFFLPLHAHTAGQRPVDPADALASLLLTAGVPAAQIPPGLEARAARWGDQVAGRKILLLLDDAAGHQQVRPLLPGTPGSLVLVTSRRRLAALGDAAVISLDTLPPGEAAALLARLAARPGLRAGDAAVGEITRPVRVPAAGDRDARQPAAPPPRPAWPASTRAAARPGAGDRLGLMQAENLSVGAAFDLSYADLTDGPRRLFRRLGLVPGPDFDAYAAAALDAATRGRPRHAVAIPAPIRGFPGGRGPWAQSAALHRSARATARQAGDRPGEASTLSTLGALQRDTGDYPAAAATLARAAALFRDLGDRPGQAYALNELGFLRALTGDYPAAAASYEQALALFRNAGDRHGQAWTLDGLGLVQQLTGDHPPAAPSLQQALALSGDLGDLHGHGQAYALNALGVVQQETGDYPAAAASQRQALALFRDLGELIGQAYALNDVGLVHQETGEDRKSTRLNSSH